MCQQYSRLEILWFRFFLYVAQSPWVSIQRHVVWHWTHSSWPEHALTPRLDGREQCCSARSVKPTEHISKTATSLRVLWCPNDHLWTSVFWNITTAECWRHFPAHRKELISGKTERTFRQRPERTFHWRRSHCSLDSIRDEQLFGEIFNWVRCTENDYGLTTVYTLHSTTIYQSSY